mmetsp:Transcript_36685/g.96053  ORF Transcript_36685/g.96053 Transcript_36685/m.96053 type:complete len:284 (+) Transcript_36685:105-956(+)
MCLAHRVDTKASYSSAARRSSTSPSRATACNASSSPFWYATSTTSRPCPHSTAARHAIRRMLSMPRPPEKTPHEMRAHPTVRSPCWRASSNDDAYALCSLASRSGYSSSAPQYTGPTAWITFPGSLPPTVIRESPVGIRIGMPSSSSTSGSSKRACTSSSPPAALIAPSTPPPPTPPSLAAFTMASPQKSTTDPEPIEMVEPSGLSSVCTTLTPRSVRAGRAAHSPGTSRSISSLSVTSVTNMWPGAWVMAKGSFAWASAACGVTPHAQNTGTSPSRIVTASP